MRQLSVEIQSTLQSLQLRLASRASGMNADFVRIQRRIRHSIRVSKALFKATREMLKTVGLLESKTDLLYVPGILFWIAWWAVFAVVLILPTYSPEMFFVFPSALALVVAWQLGMSQYAAMLLSTDLSDLKVSSSDVSALVDTLQGEGIEFPKEALTTEAAEQLASALKRVMPILALQSILRFISSAAMQALLAGCVSLVGLLIAPTLSAVVWWHGWSPVSILYAASVPSSLSLVLFGLTPFVVTRFLAGLRLRRLASEQDPANPPA